MVAFMLFILTLVFMMIARHGEDGLVEKNYYEKGQAFDHEMGLKQNAINDEAVPQISSGDSGIRIQFSAPATYAIKLRRASDEKLDKSLESRKPVRELLINESELARGPWHIRIEFEQNGLSYLHEQKLIMP